MICHPEIATAITVQMDAKISRPEICVSMFPIASILNLSNYSIKGDSVVEAQCPNKCDPGLCRAMDSLLLRNCRKLPGAADLIFCRCFLESFDNGRWMGSFTAGGSSLSFSTVCMASLRSWFGMLT
jgi:hypothetical protein